MNIKKVASCLTLVGLIGSNEIQADDCCCTPCVEYCCENHYYVGADYLYWRVWQEGLDRAGMGPQFTGPIIPLTFDWTSGFRVRAGAELCCDWGLEAEYTYLRPKGKKTISNDQIFPTFLPKFVAGGVNFGGIEVSFDSGEALFTSINSQVDMDYNVIDVQLYKLMRCTSCFDFQFSTGVEIAFIDESTTDIHVGTLNISVDQFGEDTLVGVIPIQIDWDQSWDFSGAGLRLGCEGKYTTNCGLFLASDFHLAFLFGEYKNKNNRTIPLFDASSLEGSLLIEAGFFEEIFNDYYFIGMSEKYHDFVGNAQLKLGLGWEYWWSCFGFSISAAYEATYWWDLAVFRHGLTGNAVTSSSDPIEAQFLFAGTNSSTKFSNNLALHGLVVSLNLIY